MSPVSMTTATRPRFGSLVGSPKLARLIVRRDRVLIAIWMLITSLAAPGAAMTTMTTYPDLQARQERVEQIDTAPMFVLFQSRAFDNTIGALTAQQAFAITTLTAALGAALLVARHTRGEEHAGRRELLGSTVVGRHSALAAAAGVVMAAGLVIMIAAWLGLLMVGLPAGGSFALAAVTGVAAWIGAGFAAVAAQLTERPGLAGFGAWLLFYALHLLRGAADMAGLTWLAAITPNGWLEQIRPFAGTRWWLFVPVITAAVALMLLAAVLSAHRDVGASMIRPRPGPDAAAGWLRVPIRLAWWLHRTEFTGWIAAFLVMGLVMGSMGTRAVAEYADLAWVSDWATAMGLDNPADAFLTYVIFVFVLATGVAALLAVLRLHAEETSGLAAALLSGPLTRTRWAAGRLSVALAVPVLLQFALGTGLGAGGALASGDVGELGRALSITLPLIPAVWVIVAITFLAFGLHARLAPVVGWSAILIGIIAELAVKAGLLPDLVYRAVSPFAMVSPYFQPTPVTYLLLTCTAGVLIIAGLLGLRRRDLVTD